MKLEYYIGQPPTLNLMTIRLMQSCLRLCVSL